VQTELVPKLSTALQAVLEYALSGEEAPSDEVRSEQRSAVLVAHLLTQPRRSWKPR